MGAAAHRDALDSEALEALDLEAHERSSVLTSNMLAVPKEVQFLTRVGESIGWFRRPHPRKAFPYAFATTVSISLVACTLHGLSGWIVYSQHSRPSEVLISVTGVAYFLLHVAMQVRCFGVLGLGIAEVMRALPPVRLLVNAILTAVLYTLNMFLMIDAVMRMWSTQVSDFGPLFSHPVVVALYVISIFITPLGGCICCAALASLSEVLLQDLEAARAALASGDVQRARRLYGQFLAHLRVARPAFRDLAGPPLAYGILGVSVVITQELAAFLRGRSTPARQQLQTLYYGFGAGTLLLWVASPPTSLPTAHRKLVLEAARCGCQSRQGSEDLAALLSVLSVAEPHAGLAAAGVLVTWRFLLTCVSLASALVSVLRSIA